MAFNITLVIVVLTVLVSWRAFNGQRLLDRLILWPPAIERHRQYERLLTHGFIHADWMHLLFNMVTLWSFGTAVERSMGSREFLLFYFLTGTLAGLASLGIYIATGAWYTTLLGASGALFAVLLAFAIVNPEARIFIYGILPIRAPVMVVGYAAIEVASQLFSFRSSVAHLTHLAGFLWAWLYFVLRFGINPAKRLFSRRR